MNLRLENVSKAYGKVLAVDDMSLDVPSGTIMALLGPSGSGKTTVLKIIAGLLTPDSGRIFFGNRDVTDLAPSVRRVGMVFQNLALFPNLSVNENISFPLEARGRDSASTAQRVKKVVEMVELIGLEKRYPHELSGGQQQRVAIGRAISAEVDVLLLDEPLAGLDPSLKIEISEVIKEIQKSLNITTIYVTHDQTEAVLMSDQLAILFDGSIDAFGLTSEVYGLPPTEKSARFLGASNQLECSVENIDQKSVLISVSERRVRVVKPKWWASTGAEAKILFRPEETRVVRPEDGLINGRLIAVIYGGTNIAAKVDVNGIIVHCKGNPKESYRMLRRRIGEKVGVSVKPWNIIIF